MNELLKTRLGILLNLGCTFDGMSLVHPKGVCIAYYEIDTLDELSFLKIVLNLINK